MTALARNAASPDEDATCVMHHRHLPAACLTPWASHAGLPDEDVIFVRYQNEGTFRGCIPYFIAVDRSTKSVVAAIRGTLSLEDCLTDLLCEPAELDEWIRHVPGPGPSRSFSGASPPVSPVGAPPVQNVKSPAPMPIISDQWMVFKNEVHYVKSPAPCI